MKLWKYINFNQNTSSFNAGVEHKEPLVWSNTPPDSDYIDITTDSLVKEMIISKFNKFKKDGEGYFEDVRADLYIKYTNNEIPIQGIFFIENKLEDVISKIIRGDWMTSLNLLTEITIENEFTLEVKNKLKQDIEVYIANNY